MPAGAWKVYATAAEKVANAALASTTAGTLAITMNAGGFFNITVT